jgi:hypothetical protein
MRVLVACEFSGVVRRAFRAKGHYVYSVDLLPAEDGADEYLRSEETGFHHQGDILEFLDDTKELGWDLMIAHPPCTYLCNSGVRWLTNNPERQAAMIAASAFFKALLEAPVGRIAVENPIMHKYAVELIGRRQDQIVQPWQHGHGEVKGTGLWLTNLPPLQPTNIVEGRHPRVHRASPGPERWKDRSRTYTGIANAMAEQWG